MRHADYTNGFYGSAEAFRKVTAGVLASLESGGAAWYVLEEGQSSWVAVGHIIYTVAFTTPEDRPDPGPTLVIWQPWIDADTVRRNAAYSKAGLTAIIETTEKMLQDDRSSGESKAWTHTKGTAGDASTDDFAARCKQLHTQLPSEDPPPEHWRGPSETLHAKFRRTGNKMFLGIDDA